MKILSGIAFALFLLLSVAIFSADVTQAAPSGCTSGGCGPYLCCTSFLAGTKIDIDKNGGKVSIEALKIGDSLISFDEKTSTTEESKIINIRIGFRDKYFIVHSAGRKVEASSNHPFYVGGNYRSWDSNVPLGYKRTDELSPGDTVYVLSVEGSGLERAVIDRVEEVKRKIKVYTLSVDGNNNFFAEGFAVHNKFCASNCGPPPTPPPTPPPPQTPTPGNGNGGCSCSSWSNSSCGGGSCSSSERRQTRSCNPSGCSSESRCVSDASCVPTPTPTPIPGCTVSLSPSSSSVTVGGTQTFTASVNPSNGTVDRVNFGSSDIGVATVSPSSDSTPAYRTTATGQSPGSSTIRAQVVMGGSVRCSDTSSLTVTCSCDAWAGAACGGGSCAVDQMLESRTCFPSGCASESRCVADSSCTVGCSCIPWVDSALCGGGSCSSTERRQTRTCEPSGCSSQSRCVSDPTCTVPPPLNISIPNVNLSGAGSSQPILVSIISGTVANVTFSSGNASIATVNPTFDSSAAFQTTVTGQGIGITTYNALASNGLLGFGWDTATVTVSNPLAWWQVVEGDAVSGGSISSELPGSCDPGFGCDPVLITGDPGVPTYTTALNPGSPSISSTNWNVDSTVAPAAPNYAFFESRIPSALGPIFDPPSTFDIDDVGDGTEDASGYYWLKHTGNLEIINPDAGNIGNKRAILFVDGDLIIRDVILLDDGEGFFLAIVSGNITVAASAGGVADTGPHLEGIYYAQDTFITEGGGDLQLHLRGSVAANDYSLQRELADNSQNPAEIFEYGVDQVMAFPDALTRKRLIWREVAP